MDKKTIHYQLDYQGKYFHITPKKRIRLAKDDSGNVTSIVCAVNDKELKSTHGFSYAHNKKKFSGRISPESVSNQIADIRQIVFEVTDACNLQCAYCAYGDLYMDYDTRENQNLSLDYAKTLIDYVSEKINTLARKLHNNKITISFYGGEPLLNMPFIKSVVHYLHAINFNKGHFSFNMTTNATLLKPHADFLVEHNFHILVSLDGTETHNQYRTFKNGNPTFQTIYDNLKYVQQTYPEFFEKKISFNAVIHNQSNTQEVFQFFKQEYNKIPLFSLLNNVGVKPEKQTLFDIMEKPKANIHSDFLDQDTKEEFRLHTVKTSELTRFLHQYSGNVFRNYNDLLRNPKKVKFIPTGTCLPFNRKIYVTVNGKILPCERIGHQYSLGHITSTGVAIDFKYIADKYNAYYDKMKNQCLHCYRIESCIQCLFNIQDLEAESPICPNFTNRKLFESYLVKNLNHFSHYPHLYADVMRNVILD